MYFNLFYWVKLEVYGKEKLKSQWESPERGKIVLYVCIYVCY